jgi:hypothetical protein
MAFVDIGHPKAHEAFEKNRSKFNYQNLDPAGNGSYRVKPARRPQYMGANIVPLKGTGAISVNVTASSMPFTATLAVRGADKTVQYVDLVDGAGGATVEAGGEAMLVVVNTPDALINYDPFKLTDAEKKGLDYTVAIIGATV